MSQGTIQLDLSENNNRRVWQRAAMETSLVAIAFILAVMAIMIFQFLREHEADVLAKDHLDALNVKLTKDPFNDGIKEEIRRVDFTVRRAYFQRIGFLERGGYLMLGGVLVLMVSMKAMRRWARAPYMPPKLDDSARLAGPRLFTIGGSAVAALGLAMGVTLVVLAYHPALRAPEFTGFKAVAAATPIENPTPAANGNEPAPTANATPAAAPTKEMFERNWPNFRGPGGLGAVIVGDYPTEWDAGSGKGILWKSKDTFLPGFNTPIVWEGQVFFCGAATTEKREAYCVDAATGALKWKTPLPIAPAGAQLKLEEATGYAPASMATDGVRVFACFPDADLFALDFAGKIVWKKNLGVPVNQYGHSSSLLVVDGRLIVQMDQGESIKDGKSVIQAFDVATGNMLWNVKRESEPSWASPAVIEVGGAKQIVTCGHPFVLVHDPATGKELWRVKCLDGEVVPSPIYNGTHVFVCNDRAKLVAIKPDGTGDVTKKNVAWSYTDDLPDVVSPVCSAEFVWMVTPSGNMTCVDAKTGKSVWAQDLETETHPSMVIVKNHVYLVDQKGFTHVIEAGRTFKRIAKNPLGEEVHASPAFAGGRIFIRAKEHLFCIGSK